MTRTNDPSRAAPDRATRSACFHQQEGVVLLVGDAGEVTAALPIGSVDCVVTSPPYWGLRDYRVPGQYGHESTLDAYARNLRNVFRHLRRVLAPGGSVWLNLGDSYGGSWGDYAAPGTGARSAQEDHRRRIGQHRPPQSQCRPKDLLGVAWYVAYSLQRDGWTLADAVVWHKPNARPESVRDRLSGRYEWIFRLYPYCHLTQQANDLPQQTSAAEVWSVPASSGRGTHAAIGSVEIATRCLQRSGLSTGVVLDPFSGTGTTGVAARMLGCSYIGIDLNPDFHELAKARLRQPQQRTSRPRAVGGG